MGFSTSSTTTTLTARLTPHGRVSMLQNALPLISFFGLGDSDRNYLTYDSPKNGEVLSIAGQVGSGGIGSISNGTSLNPYIKSFLVVNASGALMKPIDPQSVQITTDIISLGNDLPC